MKTLAVGHGTCAIDVLYLHSVSYLHLANCLSCRPIHCFSFPIVVQPRQRAHAADVPIGRESTRISGVLASIRKSPGPKPSFGVVEAR